MVSRVAGGDELAYRQFIKQYERLVMHIIIRIIDDPNDREEVVQDVFVRAIDKIGSFGFQSKLSTWVATIAYRHALNVAKKNKKWNEMQDLDQVAFKEGALVPGFEQEDINRFVHKAIDQLPLPYRSILTMYHLDGFSYPEIVEMTKMPEGTVKNYLFRARKKLKELLEPFVEKEVLLG